MRVDPHVNSIAQLAAEIDVIHQQAVNEYTPLVEGILRTRSQDTRQIDQTLDDLLSFCCFEPALDLYRRLCRHYWDIDPVATASHVYAYRTTWDADEGRH
ncbi:conserved hypothetical protein [Candidatus Accumulibacter aalborgensis]|uniref:Uncharacterized protein n=1 Tax=Candidatus Accumulibacter aalborgensis TaxID=1860102 RepID=A0A1A8XPU3_9PROT|nr:conserved hypothetical protein [Candidatus Accumulibacter aalborgensis]